MASWSATRRPSLPMSGFTSCPADVRPLRAAPRSVNRNERALARRDVRVRAPPAEACMRTWTTSANGAMARDVLRGLSGEPKAIPSKYFYDDRGSRLFERICELPEYYVTRAEVAVLVREADAIVGACRPDEVLELGPGSSRK